MTASQCLNHLWLKDDTSYLGLLRALETRWMRRCLARRRWYRLFNAVRVMTSMRLLQPPTISEAAAAAKPPKRRSLASLLNNYLSSSEEGIIDDGQQVDDEVDMACLDPNSPPFVRDISAYKGNFEKLHLLVNNFAAGTIYSVQPVTPMRSISRRFSSCSSDDAWNINCCDIFAARHVRGCAAVAELRREASILNTLRNVDHVVQLQGLYEGLRVSVLVTEFCGGGDLVERLSRPDFVLNESKCRVVMRQICAGLQFIHSRRIIHLDLKPFSVVFSSVRRFEHGGSDDLLNQMLVISDFGLAQQLDACPDTGAALPIKVSSMTGTTVEFMAPEMVECTKASPATGEQRALMNTD